jgi:hypothetical protein
MANSIGSTAMKIEYVFPIDQGLYWSCDGDYEAKLFKIRENDVRNKLLARVQYVVDRDQYAMRVLDGPVAKTAITYHNTMQEAKDQAVAVAVVLARLDRANNLLT